MRKTSLRAAWVVGLAVAFAAACSSGESATACVPGQQAACGCAGGAVGAQVCVDDGSRFGACDCPAGDAGGDAPDDASSDVSQDRRIDGAGGEDGTAPDASADSFVDVATDRSTDVAADPGADLGAADVVHDALTDLGVDVTTDGALDAPADGAFDAAKDAAIVDAGPLVWGVPAQSCGAGLDCGGLSCCDSIAVPGGAFTMGSATDRANPIRAATVSPFAMDTFEVTVGRFAAFVSVFNGEVPPAGSGANPHAPDSGWDATWTVAASKADLHARITASGLCNFDWHGPGDTVDPMNCVSLFQAYAFCIWDGGRLPTSAEWEFVAAGGAEERTFPWGETVPDKNSGHANWSLDGNSSLIAVGSYPAGNGRWGHRDLAGSVWEWTRDWIPSVLDPGPDAGSFLGPCNDCVSICPGCGLSTINTYFIERGGAWNSPFTFLFANFWGGASPWGNADEWMGFRCVHDLPASATDGGP